MNVEFKIREEGMTWEEAPVFATIGTWNASVVKAAATAWANLFGKEVRWNFEDVSQGHYVQPEVKDAI